MSEKTQQADATAALMEMYNRTAVQLPPDPWMKQSEDDQPVSEAMDELYN